MMNRSFHKCEKILYKKKSRESMRAVYKGLCESTHPSIKSTFFDSNFVAFKVEDTLNFLMRMCMANLMQMTEFFLEEYPKRIIRENEQLINKAAKHLGSYPNFLPEIRKHMQRN
ncbi:MAG: hypothetical protein GF334_06750 [Candidatus Altiarchaeales archaeon]|nr:hypothetical protein [Candidatus Altiarchaeales archaeon]